MKKKDGFPGQISFVIPKRILALVKDNPLISDLYITDIGYYPHALHHFRKRPVGSNQSILIYCLEGTGEICLNDKMHTVLADHYFFIPAGMTHSYHSNEQDPWSIYWIHFSGAKSGLYSRFASHPIPIHRSKTSRIHDRIDLFSEIFHHLDRGFSVETLEYVNLCLPHLLSSFTHLDQYRMIYESDEKNPVSQSINFMLEHLTEKLKLEEIAIEIGLSSSYYSRLFFNKIGHSPIDYFIQLKIQRACRLLDNSSWMIADVSREMGFDDQFYFSRVFRKVMSMSPMQYRKRKV